jgi:hypothetical protein
MVQLLNMRLAHYMLDKDGNIITTTNIDEWALWYSNIDNRRVAFEDLGPLGKVYTTFIVTIAIPSMEKTMPPQWETMYEPPGEERSKFWRWNTVGEARAGHDLIVQLIKNHDDLSKHLNPYPDLMSMINLILHAKADG